MIITLVLRCKYTSENFPRNGKFSADRMRSTIFSLEKIVLRMRSAENFPFRGKFSEVYLHIKVTYDRLSKKKSRNSSQSGYAPLIWKNLASA